MQGGAVGLDAGLQRGADRIGGRLASAVIDRSAARPGGEVGADGVVEAGEHEAHCEFVSTLRFEVGLLDECLELARSAESEGSTGARRRGAAHVARRPGRQRTEPS